MKLNVRSSSFDNFSKCGAFDSESGACDRFSSTVLVLLSNRASYRIIPERIQSDHRHLVLSLQNIAKKERYPG